MDEDDFEEHEYKFLAEWDPCNAMESVVFTAFVAADVPALKIIRTLAHEVAHRNYDGPPDDIDSPDVGHCILSMG